MPVTPFNSAHPFTPRVARNTQSATASMPLRFHEVNCRAQPIGDAGNGVLPEDPGHKGTEYRLGASRAAHNGTKVL
jgi:hypothetical protein